MSSAVQVDNKTKDIIILGEGPTQGFDDTKLTAEDKYLINFSVTRKKFSILGKVCIMMEPAGIYLSMVQKLLKKKTLKM